MFPIKLVRALLPERIEYPGVDPVPEGIQRPFWSVMIPAYNGTRYLARTLTSVLEQDPGPEEMQIEVVDDCSTEGDSEAVVKEVGKGRVAFYRHPHHVGISANFTTCVRQARGHWVHILHQDDMVLRGFYDTYKRFIEEHQGVGMVFCRAIEIDEHDEWRRIMSSLSSPPSQKFSGFVGNALQPLVERNYIMAPSVVIQRTIYERVGGFHPLLSHPLDRDMWLRVAAYGPLGYIHRPYLLCRVHVEQATKRNALSGENMKQKVEIIEIGLRLLSPELREGVRQTAYHNSSQDALSWRAHFHSQGLHSFALRQAVWAWKFKPSVRNLVRLCRSVVLSLSDRAKYEG
ncbi:MAG: glycosyltransferase family 2 protein [Candidatus Latescibacteria bacterium]|nr:glycosyltransferase family 2 protein [Candidatus Latescibacterota bacterium]